MNGLSETDQYLVRRLAAQHHVPAEELARLAPTEIDQQIPGARQAYEHRHTAAEALRRRLGIDPASVTYQTAVRDARSMLDEVDQLGRTA